MLEKKDFNEISNIQRKLQMHQIKRDEHGKEALNEEAVWADYETQENEVTKLINYKNDLRTEMSAKQN